MSVLSKFYYKKNRLMRCSKDFQLNQNIYLCCNPINERLKSYAIETSNLEILQKLKEIKELLKRDDIESWKKERNQKNCYSKLSHRKIAIEEMNNLYKNILKYSNEELDAMYEKESEEWTDWCNCVKDYYCYNKILNNRCIPILDLKKLMVNKKDMTLKITN